MFRDYRVYVVGAERVDAHPNADRLELVHVGGWQCVVQKGKIKVGDLGIYIPIDSMLPNDLEAVLFPLGSKVTLSGSRVRTIKLRGAISQGMFVSLGSPEMDRWLRYAKLGDDLTDLLGITHYEPPAPAPSLRGDMAAKKHRNPNFPAYSKLSHFKNYTSLFEEGEHVVVTEKIHGTNFRAGWVRPVADTWLKKIKKWLHWWPEWEFVYGSHNVQLNGQRNWKGFYGHNVYREAVDKYGLEDKIPKGYVLYGEIYGDGIQKGYHYGLTGERSLRLFDVLYTKDNNVQEYGSWCLVEHMALCTGLEAVPVIYDGPFSKELVTTWEQGPSAIGKQPHREGCVVKPLSETTSWIGRKVLRSINPEYLLINETDFH